MRSRFSKTVFLSLLWLSLWVEAAASTVLLRGDRRTPAEPDTVTTFGGAITFSASIVKPATALTVVWLLETFDPSQLDQARNDLASLAKRFPGRTLRLVVLRNGRAEGFGPFSSPVRLGQALDDIALPAAQAGDTPEASKTAGEAILDSLIQNADSIGADWSAVILTGKLPDLASAIRPYATALLIHTFAAHRLRVYIPSSGHDEEWNLICAATGGAVFDDFDQLKAAIDERAHEFLEVTWTPPPAPAGFVLFPTVIADDHSAAILTLTDIADHGAPLPSIAAVSDQQERLKQVSEILQQPLSENTLNQVRDLLMRAGEPNPVDPELLRLEARFCEQTGTFAEGVKAAALLARVRPTEGASYALLGHLQQLAADYDGAEKALKRAAELGIAPPELAEDYARVRLGRKDDPGALPYLESALAADAKRQDLWFLQAHTAERAHQPELAVVSYEKGLALGGVSPAESGALLRLYLSSDQGRRAHGFALRTIDTMPPQAEPRAAFAQALEDAKMGDEALLSWKSVLAVRNDVEVAHVRIARLLLDSGKANESLDAATGDLTVFPKSADLYLIRADALIRLGMEYEARGTLEEGAKATGSVAVLSRLAAIQDTYGFGAAETYSELADASQAGSALRVAAMERGCFVALREGDLKQARAFAETLTKEGRPDCRAMVGTDRRVAHDLLVPGGRDALAFISYAKKGVAPDRFLAEYANAIVAHACKGPCGGNDFKPRIQRYFDTVAQLEAMGTRTGDHVTIELSSKNKQQQKRTQEFLHLLGIDLHKQGSAVKLDMGAGQSRGKQQEILSALAIDEVGLEQALQSGQAYSIEISDDPVAMYPDSRFWQESLPSYVKGGFLTAMLENTQLPRLYAAMSVIDRRTLKALFDKVRLRDFSDESVELLSAYGSCFAVQGSSASVPGGSAARDLWAQMAGASPDRPGDFYRALLQPAHAALLAYFYELSQLDPTHQAFVTANLERLRRFYRLFESMPGSQSAGRLFMRDTSLAQLLQSIPIDNDGHLAFPGSPEVWSVAKGQGADSGKIAKMMKKVSKTAPPDVEDAVLLRLAETRYKAKSVRHTELDNFLSVSHVDAHRTEPLDPESALLLAQRYADYWPAYTYFADLSAINLDGFHGFFEMMDRLAQRPLLEQNIELGELHSLLEWISILRWRNEIAPEEAARLFGEICTRLGGAEDASARTRAVIDLAHKILQDCSKGKAGNADESLRSCLVGAGAGEPPSERTKEYDLVLDEQKAPSLAALFALDDTLAALLNKFAAGKPATVEAQRIVQIASALPSLEVPKHVPVTPKEKDVIHTYLPAEVQRRAGELSEAAQKRKPNANPARKLAREMLQAMEPQLTLALAGPVYAYFLRGSDLVVSDDPLLLRKHRYIDFADSDQRHSPMQESEFVPRNEGAGSYFTGGFAQFGLAAGHAAGTGWRHGGSGSEWMIGAQIAAIRGAQWDLLTESDQRLVSLRILAAREWMVAASENANAFDALSRETTGLLSLSRRAVLLISLEEHDWPQVWDSISLPDLFMLGSKLPTKSAADFTHSQVWDELRGVETANGGSRINYFGRIPYQALGCAHPHVTNDSPYEEYERRMPSDVGERTADLKLFLAYHADSAGVRPAEVGRIAERVAARAFQASQMTDYRDWRSLLSAYSSIENKQIMQALEQ